MPTPQRAGSNEPKTGNSPAGSTKRERREALREERARRAAQAQRQRQVRRIGFIVAAVLVVAAIALAIYFFAIAPTTTGALEGVRTIPEEGRSHVAVGQPLSYANNPPASGAHYGSPTNYGFYDRPVEEGFWVHNLEHGGIVILYKPGQPNEAELKTQLRDAVSTFRRSNSCPTAVTKLVVAPYENMGTPIMLIAWNRQLPLDAWDKDRAQAFYERFLDRGPEPGAC